MSWYFFYKNLSLFNMQFSRYMGKIKTWKLSWKLVFISSFQRLILSRACTWPKGQRPWGAHVSRMRDAVFTAPDWYLSVIRMLNPLSPLITGKNQLYFLFLFLNSGIHLLSHAVSSIVPSAAYVLTVVFGMGTGVSHMRINTRNLLASFLKDSTVSKTPTLLP